MNKVHISGLHKNARIHACACMLRVSTKGFVVAQQFGCECLVGRITFFAQRALCCFIRFSSVCTNVRVAAMLA